MIRGNIKDKTELHDHQAGKSKKDKNNQMWPGPGHAQVFRENALGLEGGNRGGHRIARENLRGFRLDKRRKRGRSNLGWSLRRGVHGALWRFVVQIFIVIVHFLFFFGLRSGQPEASAAATSGMSSS